MTDNTQTTPRLTDLDTLDIRDIEDLLAKRKQVAVIWSTEDVHEIRPDLTDNQAWEVLQRARSRHDCELGFTWQLLEAVCDELFPRQCGSQDKEDA